MTSSVEARLFKKPNKIIKNRSNLSLLEQKVFLLCLYQMKDSGVDAKVISVSLSGLREASSSLKNIPVLERLTRSLRKQGIEIRRSNGTYRSISLFEEVAFNPSEKRVDFYPTNKLKKLVQKGQLGNYTLLDLSILLNLPSGNAIRLYEILRSNLWLGKTYVVGRDDLIEMLGLDTKSTYKTSFTHLRNNVLNPTQKILNQNADLTFSYRTIKKGKRIDSISFTLIKNNPYQYRLDFDATKEVQPEPQEESIPPQDESVCLHDVNICYEKNGAECKYLQTGYVMNSLCNFCIRLYFKRKSD